MDAHQTNYAETGGPRFPSQTDVASVRRFCSDRIRRPAVPAASAGQALDKTISNADIMTSGMNDIDLDIDALLSSAHIPDVGLETDLAGLYDRQIASNIAQETRTTTLLIIGNLSVARSLPARCEDMCPSFKLISIRRMGKSQIAMFSVPVESEMAELFEEIDGRCGVRAIAYDSKGRPKESYIL